MIDKKGFVKLTDFGLSKKIKRGQENVFSISGMPEYTAPEILFQRDCTKAVDFWCLGSLLHEMVTGFPPFFSENLNELYESIKFQDFIVDEEFQLSESCVSLLEGLFKKDPTLRLGMGVYIHLLRALVKSYYILGSRASIGRLSNLASTSLPSYPSSKATKIRPTSVQPSPLPVSSPFPRIPRA